MKESKDIVIWLTWRKVKMILEFQAWIIEKMGAIVKRGQSRNVSDEGKTN